MMSVRGGKNRVLVYTGAGLFLVALVLFYHNAATKLEDARSKFDKCHLNEESLSAQLQVILEYKTRLEKSLQQEKSDYAQTKEEMRNKVEEERLTRERENLESINKFTALQQQYKLLKSQHEDVTLELEKAKRQILTDDEDRSHWETQIKSLTQQNKLLLDDKESDQIVLKAKLTKLEADYEALKKEKNVTQLVKEHSDLERELAECLRNNSKTAIKTGDVSLPEDTINAPSLTKLKSSTAASKIEIVSGAAVVFNTSTPLINPDAVQSQDRTATGGQLGKVLNIPALGNYREQQNVDEIPRPNRQIPQAPRPVNEIPRNQVLQAYEDEFDGRKEEEDDDVDNMEFDQNAELAPAPAKPPPGRKVIIENSRDAVMLNPK